MTNSVIETPEVGVRTVRMTVCTSVWKRLRTLPSHPALDEPQGVSLATLAKKQTIIFGFFSSAFIRPDITAMVEWA